MKTVKLSDYIFEVNDRTTENDQYTVLTSSQAGIVTQAEYFNKKVASKDTTGYKIVRFGQFTYRAMSDTGQFYINRQECCEAGIVSPAYPVFSVRDDKDLAPEFLQMFFKTDYFQSLIVNQSTGSTRVSLKLDRIKAITITVPTYDEQLVIVEKLHRLAKVIEARKEQAHCMDELLKSRFIELFGDLEQKPKGYPTQKLSSLATKISDGVHAKPEYTLTGRPFLSVVNINTGRISFEGCKFVSEEAYQAMIKSTHPERGDVLYTKVGATYGIPAYVDTDTEFCLYVSVSLIKPRHDEIDSRFLALSMAMPYVKRQADSRVKGIGVPDLHLNQIREFDIICPPRSEQEAYVAFAEQTDKSKLAVQKGLEELEILKKSLMQQYFG